MLKWMVEKIYHYSTEILDNKVVDLKMYKENKLAQQNNL